ncbi:MAG: solute carrier family 26 protein [Calditrichaceae bacterium]|nr:solute carrier family 26 protein [Calditrichia bacterium]NUQ43804.1 solute carrier family 26 protein [Calditrichaceae bacterium]
MINLLGKFFPVMNWLPRYRREDLPGDLGAGLTVAVMLIPQGMAYALLAGLPPITGLYASVVPLVVYALFGTSRQLAVGPVAMVSLLVASGIGHLAEPNSAQFVALAAVLALLAGLLQFLMGLARMGFLVNFLSHPVISGFTSAAALIIGFSQLKHLLGIHLPRSEQVYAILWNAMRQIQDINMPTFIIGAGSIVVLLLLRRWKPLFPAALLVVALSILTVWFFRLDAHGVAIVGEVPRGLSSPSLPHFSADTVAALLPIAITISLVGFMESIAVAKSFAAKNRYEVDANQELIGLGLANVAAGLFGGYPVTGGFSRTAVNARAGARSGLASIITAAMIALTLLFLTPLFYFLPNAVLAAIIMAAVFSLIDVKEIRHLYKVKRSDLLLLILAFFATLILGIEEGILLSIVASLILVIHKTTRPHTAILGQMPGTEIYRNVARYPEVKTFAGVAIFRFDASLYFANIAYLKDRLQEIANHSEPALRAIIFDAVSVNDIDSSADAALREIVQTLRSRGIDLYFSNLKGPVRDVLKRSGFYDLLGADHFFYCTHDAVRCVVGEEAGIRHEGQYLAR